MVDTENNGQDPVSGYYLDITSEVCPLTFVRTKLLIERMRAGETAVVRLRGAEPLANVPRSVEAQGHVVVALVPEDEHGPADGIHRLTLTKR